MTWIYHISWSSILKSGEFPKKNHPKNLLVLLILLTSIDNSQSGKEDSSAQGQIVTEILQHLHACNNSVKVFYGREESLERIENYMMNYSEKPLVLYGEVSRELK